MSYSKLFQVKPGSKVRLNKIDPDFTAGHTRKKSAVMEVEKLDRKLRALQYLLYAEGKRSLLLCLQALDAAGKDGTINHVLGSMNPQGARVHGFKTPTKEEAEHDFLWRIEQQAPKQGEVVIFNRSHYEDILVVRVHHIVSTKVWKGRYELINSFERNLVENGTHILKFFLHISPEVQLLRFKQRLDDPARHWKISESDYAERGLWNDYIAAYEEALSKTSTRHAPWFVIPSNNKWFRNLAVAKIVVETLESLNMRFPEPTVDIEAIARKYHRAELEEEKKLGKGKWEKYVAKKERKATKSRKDAEIERKTKGGEPISGTDSKSEEEMPGSQRVIGTGTIEPSPETVPVPQEDMPGGQRAMGRGTIEPSPDSVREPEEEIPGSQRAMEVGAAHRSASTDD